MPKTRQMDRVLLGATVLTAALGVVMVGSASGPLAREYYRMPEYEFAFRQLLAVLLGGAGMLAAAFVPLERLASRKVAFPLLAITWVALLVAYLQPKVAETHRWLQLPIGSMQPSAVAKLTLPLALAALFAAHRKERQDPRMTTALALGMTALTVVLVLFEPDLGSAILLLAGAVTVLLLADVSWKPLAATGAVAVVLFVAAILAKPYRIERVRSHFGESSYHVQQSLIAVGSGGLLGRGPGQSVQKLFYLPQPHTDFIFSVLGEEVGLFGTTLVLALLGVIVTRALIAAHRANTLSASLVAAGLAVTLATQALINISVCLKLIPAKGLPLPLISSGGSDVVMTLVAIGLLLNVAKEAS